MTHIRLAAANEEVLAGALRSAWKLRLEKNAKSSQKNRALTQRSALPVLLRLDVETYF
jgi:hypothetical protein